MEPPSSSLVPKDDLIVWEPNLEDYEPGMYAFVFVSASHMCFYHGAVLKRAKELGILKEMRHERWQIDLTNGVQMRFIPQITAFPWALGRELKGFFAEKGVRPEVIELLASRIR